MHALFCHAGRFGVIWCSISASSRFCTVLVSDSACLLACFQYRAQFVLFHDFSEIFSDIVFLIS